MCTKRTQARLRFIHFLINGKRIWKAEREWDEHLLRQKYKNRENANVFNFIQQIEKRLVCAIVSYRQKMKNKSANEKALELHQSETIDTDIVATSSDVVTNYLHEISYIKSIEEPELKKLYEYVRGSLRDSLGPRESTNPIYAALIERIARTAVILDKIEKAVFTVGHMTKEDLLSHKYKGSSYPLLLTEHRKCIETFMTLIHASKTKGKGKVVETLKTLIRQEETES